MWNCIHQIKINRVLMLLSIVLVSAGAYTSKAQAHPHDLLAQCQLPNGKWVMCDETKHSLTSGQHVPKSKSVKGGAFKVTQKNRRNKRLKIYQRAKSPLNKRRLKITGPFVANCANGFSKVGQKKMANGDMKWYVCSTPIIQCPSYVQKNGKKAYVKPKAIVQLIGANPDGGTQKFRVQYKCEYSFNAWPVP
jgi:hypothetical protein